MCQHHLVLAVHNKAPVHNTEHSVDTRQPVNQDIRTCPNILFLTCIKGGWGSMHARGKGLWRV